jgi:hypothetical protein
MILVEGFFAFSLQIQQLDIFAIALHFFMEMKGKMGMGWFVILGKQLHVFFTSTCRLGRQALKLD